MMKFIKKLVVTSFASLWLVSLLPSGVSAVTNIDSLLYNLSASYDVQIRANGENVVTTKLTLTNNNDTDLTSISLESDNTPISEAIAYQKADTTKCVVTPVYRQQTTTTLPAPKTTCSTYYNDGYYYYTPQTKSEYTKATVARPNDSKIDIAFVEPVKKSESTTIVILYIANGNVTKDISGVYNYSFKSLKTSFRTKDISVVIKGDTDMYLSDPNGRVAYTSNSVNEKSVSSSLMQGASLDSATMDNYVDTIGTSGTVRKTATNLAPYETLSVNGKFSYDSWRFSIKNWLIAGALVVLLVGIYIIMYKRKRKQLKSGSDKQGKSDDGPKNPPTTDDAKVDAPVNDNSPQQDNSNVSASASTIVVSEPIVIKPTKKRVQVEALPFYSVYKKANDRFTTRGMHPFVVSLLCVVSSLVIIFSIVGIFSSGLVGSSYGYYGEVNFYVIATTVIALLVGFLGVILTLVAVPYWYASKFLNGKGGFMRMTLANILLLIVLLIIGIILIQFTTTNNDDSPYYDCPNCVQPMMLD